MTVVLRPARADEIRRLRRDVLRPGGPLDPPPYDLDPATRHVGAFDAAVVVGCATVFPQPYGDYPLAWQLRGMAVDPARQGEGIGRLVLIAAVEAAAEGGAPVLWAYGRVSALGFYERLGWQAIGDVFTYGPAELPHRVILRPLTQPLTELTKGTLS
jgi:GNAT superfamily N-acetyltransferase